MVEGGGGARLAAKTLQGLHVLGYIVGKKLESDKATERSVFGFVDHAHPAAAELFDDAVMRKGASDHLGRILLGVDRQVN
jgi:hypothetical protein